MAYYNPKAYVPGGSTPKVARAIQARGKTKPRKTPAGQAPAGAPKPKAKAKPKPYAGYLSPAEVIAQSRAEAQKILDATVAPIQAQSDRLGPQYAAAGEGLARSLEPISGQIAGLYSNNASAQRDLAGGYSQAVQGVLNAGDAAQAGTLAQLGLPALGASPNAAVGDVIYGTGGSLPAQTMGTTGTAMAAAAAFLPASARIQARADTTAAQQKYRDDIALLRAKQPEIYQSLLESGRGYQDSLADNALQRYDTFADNQINARAQTLYEKQYGIKANETSGLDVNGNPMPGYTVSPDGQTLIPPGYEWKNGKVVKSKAPSNAKTVTERKAEARQAAVQKRNDETADAIVDMTTWLSNQAKGMETVVLTPVPVKIGTTLDPFGTGKQVPVYRTKNGGTTTNIQDPNIVTKKVTEEQQKKVNYTVARDYIRGTLHARLDRFGWTKKQVNEMAARILAAAHINPPKGKPKPKRNRAADAKPLGG